MKPIRLVFLLLLLTGLDACRWVTHQVSQPAARELDIRGLRIENRSFALVTEVTLLVTKTGEFISCGNIPMRGRCSTTFPLRQYQGNHIEIKWKQGGTQWSTGEFVVDPPAHIDPSRPAVLRVIITTDGLAATELVQ